MFSCFVEFMRKFEKIQNSLPFFAERRYNNPVRGQKRSLTERDESVESRQTQTNIVPYRKKRSFHFIGVVFSLILIYLAVQVYRLSTGESLQIFSIKSPVATSASHDYRGVITREERIVLTSEEGCVNYYVREGRKVSVGSTIYTTDEEGAFAQMLASTYTDGTSLSEDELKNLKKKLVSAQTVGAGSYFAEVYNDKRELASMVTDSFLFTALEELAGSGQNTDGVKTQESGYVLFRTDGMEGLTPEQVTMDTFQEENLKPSVYTTGDRRSANSFAYKLVPDDTFSVTFPITEEDAARYQNNRYLSIELVSLNVTVNGSFSMFTSADGTPLATVTFTKYGSNYLTDRYADIRIAQTPSEGYKIPVSALTKKDFFVIPREFLVKEEKSGLYHVCRESLDGQEEVSVSVYAETDTQYYIAASELEIGDYLIEEDGGSRFLLSAMSPLDGVFQVNRGYCIFRRVDVIETTADGGYYIVKTGSKYGISTNDRIVQDAELVVENQIIN